MTEKSQKLRQFVQKLRNRPLNQPFDAKTWQAYLDSQNLTLDDENHIVQLRKGHWERGFQALEAKDVEAACQEWQDALSLGARDSAQEQALEKLLKNIKSKQSEELYKILIHRRSHSAKNRTGKKDVKPVLFGALLGLAVLGVFLFLILQPKNTIIQGPHPATSDLKLTIDTGGIAYKAAVDHCQLQSFSEAQVVELSFNIWFPQDAVEAWNGQLMVLDDNKNILASQDLNFIPPGTGILNAGQKLTVFRQIDAQLWAAQAAEIFIKTTKLTTSKQKYAQAVPLALAGTESLTSGYSLSAVLLNGQWNTSFEKEIHVMDIELQNTGVKPFTALTLQCAWKDAQGKILKTRLYKSVKEGHSPLASGEKIALHVEGEFPSEIFNWPQGNEPTPEIKLLDWK